MGLLGESFTITTSPSPSSTLLVSTMKFAGPPYTEIRELLAAIFTAGDLKSGSFTISGSLDYMLFICIYCYYLVDNLNLY